MNLKLLTAFTAAMIGFAGTASAQDVTLKLGHVLSPTHQFHKGMELAAEKLAESTNGKVKLEVFPSSQLGTERDMHVSIRTGGVDMLLASPGGASVHLSSTAISVPTGRARSPRRQARTLWAGSHAAPVM